MKTIKSCINTPGKLKTYICFMDAFAIRYIAVFFMIAAANALVLKILFDQKGSNQFSGYAMLITAILVSWLWAKLAVMTEFSVFEHTLPVETKKKELSKRGTCIAIYYLLLSAIRSSKPSELRLLSLIKKLVEFSFAVTLLILIMTFIMILVAKTPQRKSSIRSN